MADYRYLLTLKEAIRQARVAGRNEAADRAERTLEAVEDKIDAASLGRSTVRAMGLYNTRKYPENAIGLYYRPAPQEDMSSDRYDGFRRRLALEIMKLTGKD